MEEWSAALPIIGAHFFWKKIFKNPKHFDSQKQWKNVPTVLLFVSRHFLYKKRMVGHRLALAGGEIPAVAFYGRNDDETTTTRHQYFSRGLICVQEWWCVRCCDGALFSFFSDV